MSATALRESEVSHGDHDGQKGFREDFLNVVDEEALHSARSFRKDRSGRVRVLEILGYVVGVGQRFPATGIVDNGEGVNWSTIGTIGGRGDIELAEDVLNVGRFDPMRAIWKTFVVEDESDSPNVWSPWLGYRRLDVVESDNGLRH